MESSTVKASKNTASQIGEILEIILENQRRVEKIRESSLQDERDKLLRYLQTFHDYFFNIQTIMNEEKKGRNISQLHLVAKKEFLLKLGLKFLSKREIHKPSMKINPIPSITEDYWLRFFSLISRSTKMKISLQKLKQFYNSIIESRIELIFENLPISVTPEIKERFRKEYYNKPITFEEFISKLDQQKESDQKKETSEKSEDYRKNFEKALEQKKIEEEKQKQLESFDNYQQYFSMSDRELKRAKRKGTMRRKYQKKSRRDKY